VLRQPELRDLAIGYFGSSTGVAAPLVAATRMLQIRAIVARGGRPDLAGAALAQVRAPTLLVAGGDDPEILELNRRALARMSCEAHLEIVPSTTHLFSEPGTLEQTASARRPLARTSPGRLDAGARARCTSRRPLTQPMEVPLMYVQDLMTRQAHACRPEESLERAAQLMWDHDCGCLPVCSGGDNGARRIVGVITDRDICMNALFLRKPLGELHVNEAMSREVRTCRASDSLARAEKIMREARVRRLPVLDDNGGLVGMISLADLALEAARQRRRVSKEVTDTEVGDTLSVICESARRTLAA